MFFFFFLVSALLQHMDTYLAMNSFWHVLIAKLLIKWSVTHYSWYWWRFDSDVALQKANVRSGAWWSFNTLGWRSVHPLRSWLKQAERKSEIQTSSCSLFLCAVFAEGSGDEDTAGSWSSSEPHQVFPSPAQVGFVALHLCSDRGLWKKYLPPSWVPLFFVY